MGEMLNQHNNIPPGIENKTDTIFSNIREIYEFHDKYVSFSLFLVFFIYHNSRYLHQNTAFTYLSNYVLQTFSLIPLLVYLLIKDSVFLQIIPGIYFGI